MIDWTGLYIEEDSRERAQYFWVSTFFYFAKYLIDDYGLAGEKSIRKAIRDFGTERGRWHRQCSDAAGLPVSMVSYGKFVDLVNEPRFSEKPADGREYYHKVEPELIEEKFYVCPNADMWARLEGKKPGEYLSIGSIYCEEVHHKLFGEYDPAVQVNLVEALAKGDDCCNFRIHLREANIDSSYVPPRVAEGAWRDYGDNETDSIYGMFCLHFTYYAKRALEDFGMDEVRRIIRAWANERGARLKELARRKGEKAGIKDLVRNGDLFLDSREKTEFCSVTDNEAVVEVGRSILGEVLRDHDAAELALPFYEETLKGITEVYDPSIRTSVGTLGNGEGFRLEFRMETAGGV